MPRSPPIRSASRRPRETWRDVNPALPAVPIRVYGPPPTSGTRDSFAELILDKGCDTDPAMKALKEQRRGPSQADSAPRSARTAPISRRARTTICSSSSVAENQGAIGVLGYCFLEENADRVRGIPIGGVAPTAATIADFTYPGRAQALHLRQGRASRRRSRAFASSSPTGRRAGARAAISPQHGLIPLPDADVRRRCRRPESDADHDCQPEVIASERRTLRPGASIEWKPERVACRHRPAGPRARPDRLAGGARRARRPSPARPGRGPIRCRAITAGTSRLWAVVPALLFLAVWSDVLRQPDLRAGAGQPGGGRRCPRSACSARRSSAKPMRWRPAQRRAAFNPQARGARAGLCAARSPSTPGSASPSPCSLAFAGGAWSLQPRVAALPRPHPGRAAGDGGAAARLAGRDPDHARHRPLAAVRDRCASSRWSRRSSSCSALNWSPQTAIRADQAGSSGAFGAVPLFWGTIFIGAIIAMIVAIPLGLMSAIYLTQYASPRAARAG